MKKCSGCGKEFDTLRRVDFPMCDLCCEGEFCEECLKKDCILCEDIREFEADL